MEMWSFDRVFFLSFCFVFLFCLVRGGGWEGGGIEELSLKNDLSVFFFLFNRSTALCSGLTGDLSQKLKELPRVETKDQPSLQRIFIIQMVLT